MLNWVAWFNSKFLLEPLGDFPPIEFEEKYYRRDGMPAENGFTGWAESDDRGSA
jgi:hypothetical protein